MPSQEHPVKTITVNRRARFDYAILDTYEAGLVLTGTEIKSVRAGRVNIRDAYAGPEGGELWLFNSHIARYDAASIHNHEPTRPRKLLLRRDEMADLIAKVSRRGFTIVPLRLYIKGRVAKVELGLARGKRKYEKREAIIEREADREIERGMKHQE
ncbi:MAG: SsrA-binding protein SmpB [Chloroflexi bacterium]|nr:SsrA-binding protein SmpB [Chloroflexota bacterium]